MKTIIILLCLVSTALFAQNGEKEIKDNLRDIIVFANEKYLSKLREVTQQYEEQREELDFYSQMKITDFCNSEEQRRIEVFIRVYTEYLQRRIKFYRAFFDEYRNIIEPFLVTLDVNEQYTLEEEFLTSARWTAEEYLGDVYTSVDTFKDYVKIFEFVLNNKTDCKIVDGELMFESRDNQDMFEKHLLNMRSVEERYKPKM